MMYKIVSIVLIVLGVAGYGSSLVFSDGNLLVLIAVLSGAFISFGVFILHDKQRGRNND